MSQPQLEKVTIRTFAGDCGKLSVLFPTIGYNKVIRHLVHNLIKKIEEKSQQTNPTTVPDISESAIQQIIEDAEHDTNN